MAEPLDSWQKTQKILRLGRAQRFPPTLRALLDADAVDAEETVPILAPRVERVLAGLGPRTVDGWRFATCASADQIDRIALLAAAGGTRALCPDELVTGIRDSELLNSRLAWLAAETKHRAARTGANDFYLLAGAFQWEARENQDDLQERWTSPLLFLPVELSRASPEDAFRVCRGRGEPVVNPLLRFFLHHRFGVELPSLVDDLDYEAYRYFMENLGRLLTRFPSWQLLPLARFQLFSLDSAWMYTELAESEAECVTSSVVRQWAMVAYEEANGLRQELSPRFPNGKEQDDTLLSSVSRATSTETESSADDSGSGDKDGGDGKDSKDSLLELVDTPETLSAVFDASDDQLRCLVAADRGWSFAVAGVAGTGKIRTLANIAGSAAASGKTVLVVSQDLPALDCFAQYFRTACLEHLLFPLNGDSASRRGAARHLDALLRMWAEGSKEASPSRNADNSPGNDADPDDCNIDELCRRRGEFRHLQTALRETRASLGMSLIDAMDRIIVFREELPEKFLSVFMPPPLPIDAVLRSRVLDAASRLSATWMCREEGEPFFWQDLDDALCTQVPADIRDEKEPAHTVCQAALSAAQSSHQALQKACVDAGVTTGVSPCVNIAETERFLSLLDHLEERPDFGPPLDWYTAEDLDDIEDALGTLSQESDRYRELCVSLADVCGDHWKAFDPAFAQRLRVANRILAESEFPWQLPVAHTDSRLRRLVEFISESVPLLRKLSGDAQELAECLGLGQVALSADRAHEIALFCRAQVPAIPSAWLEHEELPRLRADLVALTNLGYQEERARMEVLRVFTPDVFALDLPELASTLATPGFFRVFSPTWRRARKTLHAYTSERTSSASLTAVLAQALQAEEVAARSREVFANSPLGKLTAVAVPTSGAAQTSCDTQPDLDLLRRCVETVERAFALGKTPEQARALLWCLESVDEAPENGALLLVGRIDDWLEAGRVVLGPHLPALRDAPLDRVVSWCEAVLPALETLEAITGGLARRLQRSVSLAEATDILRRCNDASTIRSHFSTYAKRYRSLFGPAWKGVSTDWKKVSFALHWTIRIRRLLGGPVSLDTARALRNVSLSPCNMRTAFANWQRDRKALLQCVRPQRHVAWAEYLDASYEESALFLDKLQRTLSDIPNWVAHMRARAELEDAGWGVVVRACTASLVPGPQVPSAVEWALLTSWLQHAIETDQRLRIFLDGDFGLAVDEFARLDRGLSLLAVEHIQETRQCRLEGKEGLVDMVRRQAGMRRRQMPVEMLIRKTAPLFAAVTPVMLATPAAVFRHLPSDLHFDLVLVDGELSVLDAVPAIRRGTQVIVAGTPSQKTDVLGLRPVVGTGTGTGTGAVQGARPGTGAKRKITDRSFSLEHQDDALSALAVEATASTQENATVRTEPGVRADGKTLSEEQMGREKETVPAGTVKSLERAGFLFGDLSVFEAHSRAFGAFPLTVRYRESASGETRWKHDFSQPPLVSPGALPDSSKNLDVGVLSEQSFSPMSAVPMASLPTLHAKPVRVRGKSAAGVIADENQDPLLRHVSILLRSWGFETVTGVGSPPFPADLVVRDPEERGRFLLAVLIDSIRVQGSVRQVFRMRSDFLDRRGWQVHRIWRLGWYLSPAQETKALFQSVTHARSVRAAARAAAPSASPASPSLGRGVHSRLSGDSVTPEQRFLEERPLPVWAETYFLASLKGLFSPPAAGSSAGSFSRTHARSFVQSDVPRALLRVVGKEEPVHESQARARVASALPHGGHPLSDAVPPFLVMAVQEVLDALVAEGRLARDRAGFLRSSRTSQVRVRLPGKNLGSWRAPQHVALEEIAAAVRHIVTESRLLTEEEVVQRIQLLYAWKPSKWPFPVLFSVGKTDTGKEAIEEAITCLLDSEVLEGRGGLLCLSRHDPVV